MQALQLHGGRAWLRPDRIPPHHAQPRSGIKHHTSGVEDRCSNAVQSRSAGMATQALPSFSPGQDGPEGGTDGFENGTEQPADHLRYTDLFLPAHASAEDWRTYRAKLVDIEQRQPGGQAQRSEQQRMICQPEQWAHLLSGPELGCLLLARRTEAASDSEQGVVLLVNHEREGGSGTSYGFYLNKPWRRRRACGFNMRDGMADAFKERTVYQGGMVSNRLLHVVHTCPQVQGSQEILEGVYAGGLPHANALVKEGQVAVHRFKLVAGYMGWDAGQLRREVDEGRWWAVAASAPLVVSFIQGTCPEETVGGEQEAMWHEVLNLAGVPVKERPCPRIPPFL